MSYQASILLIQQLVSCCQSIPVLLFDEFFYFLVGQVDSIVEVSAPENVVMGVQKATLVGANMQSPHSVPSVAGPTRLTVRFITMGKVSLRVISL